METSTGNNYKWLALLTVSIGTFMGTLDASIVIISLPRLTEVFDTEPSVVLWVTIAYLLASVSLMLMIGKLGDVFGKKRVYVTGFALFTVGLILCALSQTIVQLILARIVQAIGSAMVFALGNAIVTAAFPERERGKALGIVGGVVSAGLLSGPVIGGLLLGVLDWQALFYLRIPIGVIGVFMSWRLLREPPGKRDTGRFDWAGAATLFGGLTCLLLFFNLGGTMGFAAPLVLALAVGAVTLLVIFVRIERRAAAPILDLPLFRNPLFARGLGSMGAMFLATAAYVFLMPFYLLQGVGLQTSQAGLLLATTSATTLIVGPISGWLSDRIGSRVLCTAGTAIIGAGILLLSQLDADSTTLAIVSRLAVVGLGLGLFSAPNNSSIMGAVPQAHLSTASAMIATTRQIGMSSGMAIAGAIFAARQVYHSAQLAGENLAPAALDRLSLVNSFQDSLALAAIFCVIAVAASWLRGGRQALETPTETQGSR
ncbi:MAG: MFS transporter [Dehalococcoidales bacterium]